MRHLFFTSLFSVVIFNTLVAQSAFLFAPNSFEEIIETDEMEHFYKLSGTMENTSNEPLEIDWKVIDMTLPSEWTKCVSDKELFYFYAVQESPSPVLLEANESDVQFSIYFYPEGQAGCASLKAVFTEHHTGVVLDTVEYLISINDSSCITTSTTSTVEESVQIFPNPTNGLVQLTNSEAIREWSLYDLNGKELLFQKAKLDEMDMTQFPSGMYILKVQTFNQQQEVFRILKE